MPLDWLFGYERKTSIPSEPGTAFHRSRNSHEYHQDWMSSLLGRVDDISWAFVCFVIHMSHLVGDAKTLYDIVGQLNATLAGRAITALDWECPARNSFELLPLSLKDRQTVMNYGCFGWLGQFLFGPARQNHVSLLSKSLIEQEKELFKKRQRPTSFRPTTSSPLPSPDPLRIPTSWMWPEIIGTTYPWITKLPKIQKPSEHTGQSWSTTKMEKFPAGWILSYCTTVMCCWFSGGTSLTETSIKDIPNIRNDLQHLRSFLF